MIVNIRGTNGAGKSTLVKRIMDACVSSPIFVAGRKRPFGYLIKVPRLFIPGHYEIACGGCDTFKTVDAVYDAVYAKAELGYRVLYEGIMVQDDVRRAVELSKKYPLTVIMIVHPEAECIAAVQKRRDERGDERPFNPAKTKQRLRQVDRSMFRLKDAGVATLKLSRDEALLKTAELLEVSLEQTNPTCEPRLAETVAAANGS